MNDALRKLTYDSAAKLLQEKSPDPQVLIEAKDASFIETPTTIVANLFITAQTKLRENKTAKTVPSEVRNAIEEYLTALEKFEKGTLQTHAKKGSIADLL